MTCRSVPVNVKLHSLQGVDGTVLDEDVVLLTEGAERTAFRFSLNAEGGVTGSNHLSAELVE